MEIWLNACSTKNNKFVQEKVNKKYIIKYDKKNKKKNNMHAQKSHAKPPNSMFELSQQISY